MKNYFKIMLGHKSRHADECFEGGFIGADYDIHKDLAGRFGGHYFYWSILRGRFE